MVTPPTTLNSVLYAYRQWVIAAVILYITRANLWAVIGATLEDLPWLLQWPFQKLGRMYYAWHYDRQRALANAAYNKYEAERRHQESLADRYKREHGR